MATKTLSKAAIKEAEVVAATLHSTPAMTSTGVKVVRPLAGKLGSLDFPGYPVTSFAQALGERYVKADAPRDNRIVADMIATLAPDITAAKWKTLRNTVLGNANKHLRENPPSSSACVIAKAHFSILDTAWKDAKAAAVEVQKQKDAIKAEKIAAKKAEAAAVAAAALEASTDTN
jgi:hypothetical protein